VRAYKNRAVVLKKLPCGKIQDGDLVLEDYEVRPPNEGEVVAQVLWLSLDPYMRTRINNTPNILNKPVIGESVAQIVETRSDRLEVGDLITCFSGWQEYVTLPADALGVNKIQEKNNVPISVYIGIAGMPGRTGYCGMLHVGKPKAGDTVVVSAAAGAVGSVAGQTAKKQGCRVVGIVSGAEKCNYVTETLGFDVCVDRTSSNLEEVLKVACPNGIDIYFESVGGDVTRAVAPLLNLGARVPISGAVSTYNAVNTSLVETPENVFDQLDPVPEYRRFVVSEWKEQRKEITELLISQIAAGELKYCESIVYGIENAVTAFDDMLEGKSFGKQLVYVSEKVQVST
jgi:NADPH-dependent curcumin reductase CurA